MPPDPQCATAPVHTASFDDMREKGELQRTYYALLHAVVHNGLAATLLKRRPARWMW